MIQCQVLILYIGLLSIKDGFVSGLSVYSKPHERDFFKVFIYSKWCMACEYICISLCEDMHIIWITYSLAIFEYNCIMYIVMYIHLHDYINFTLHVYNCSTCI